MFKRNAATGIFRLHVNVHIMIYTASGRSIMHFWQASWVAASTCLHFFGRGRWLASDLTKFRLAYIGEVHVSGLERCFWILTSEKSRPISKEINTFFHFCIVLHCNLMNAQQRRTRNVKSRHGTGYWHNGHACTTAVKPGHMLQTAANAEKKGCWCCTCLHNPSKIWHTSRLHAVIANSEYGLILIKVRINCTLHGNVWLGIWNQPG